jgi:hypothetical protein
MRTQVGRALKASGVAVLTATAVALPMTAGMAAAAPAPSAAGAKVRLTVKVIDRDGSIVAPLNLQILNLRTMVGADMGTGTTRSVPPGRYNVAAWITTGTAPNQSYTLDDQVVDLTGSRTITLDARQGHLVRVRLNVPAAREEVLEIAPVFGFHDWAFDPTTVVNVPAHDTYVVPAAIRGLTFNAYSVWEKAANTIANPSPFRYDIVSIFHGGIPAHPDFAVRQASLARVDVTVRATDASQQAYLSLSPFGKQILPLNDTTTLGATPARVMSYRTPGFEWQPIVGLNSPYGNIRDNNLDARSYGKGHFRETYGAAVLAPNASDIFADVSGRRLQVGESQFPIQDPLSPTDEGSGLTKQFRLYSGGKLLGHSAGGNLNVRIPWARHWYTLRLNVARQPGATLSTQIAGVWHFPANGVPRIQGDGSPPIYEVKVLPAGLNLRNQAAPGALTRVALTILGPISPNPVLLPVVRAYASANDGSTWARVAAHVRGSHYVLSVRDPGHAGFVSLRIYVRDASGVSEQMTVIHAYGVR